MKPEVFFGAELADSLHVVDNAEISGAGSAGDCKQAGSVFRAEFSNCRRDIAPRELVAA